MSRSLLDKAEARRYLGEEFAQFAADKREEAACTRDADERRLLLGRARIAECDAAANIAAAELYERLARGEAVG